MKMPILAYGHAVLRQPCSDIPAENPELEKFIDDLWETMYGANGCGLAAPQVGKAVRVFVVDSRSAFEQLDEKRRQYYFHPEDGGIRETFINAHVIGREGNVWEDDEGCLSIPGINENIKRSWTITIEYLDRSLNLHRRTFHGMTARMIQHEYDHTEGILLTDHLNGIKKKLLGKKLKKIEKGLVKTAYRMKFI